MPPPSSRRAGSQVAPGSRKRARKKKPQTTRGPQGLPTQASSPQRPAPPPRRASRPAPKVQPGPIREPERRKAAKYKQTPEYRESVRVARKTRPLAVRAARVALAERHERDAARQKGEKIGLEDRVVLDQHRSEVERNSVLKEGRARSTGFTDAERRRVEDFKKSKTYKDALKAAKPKPKKDAFDKVAGVTADVIGALAAQPVKDLDKGLKDVGIKARPSRIASDFIRTQTQTARATAEDPGKVIGATAKAVPGTAKAAIAGTVDLLAHPTPGKIANLATSTAEDLNKRGDEARKNPTKFRARKKREGAIPELADAAMVASAGGAGFGRAATALAKKGVAGQAAKRAVTAPRPKLRKTAGGPAAEQELSKNAFKIVAQRKVDASRAKTARKREMAAQADPENHPLQGLIAGEGEVVKKSLRAQKRDQRKAVATAAGRGFTRLQARQHAEVHHGIRRDRRQAKKKLARKDRGIFDDVETLALQGLVHHTDAKKTRQLLETRKQKVLRTRVERKTGLIPKHADEVARIDRVLKALDENPERVLTPQLREYHDKQVARKQRVREKDDTLDTLDADVREWEPLARTLGESDRLDAQLNAIDKRQGKKGLTDEQADAARRQVKQQFVERMRQRAQAEGLPEPVYVMHRPRRNGGFGDYAPGGARTVQGTKKTEYKLFDEGRADTTPAAYEQGVARTIKRSVNWNTVNDIIERHTPGWGKGKTMEQLRREIDERGLNTADWQIVDVGNIRRERTDTDVERRDDDLDSTGDHAIHKAVERSTFDIDGAESRFKATGKRFVMVPKAVADELQGMTRPSGGAARTFQKIQGTTSRAILSTSPLYVPVQVASNALLSTAGTAGRNLAQMLPGRDLYKRLEPESKEFVDELLGVSPSRDMGRSPRYGSVAPSNRIVHGYQALVDSDVVQAAKTSRLNPFTWNRRLDEIQNNYFRHKTFQALVKKENTKGVVGATNRIVADLPDLVDILKMPDGPDKVRALRQAEPRFEKVAEQIDDLLGNWTRYTVNERRYLRSSLLFYGFLRFATKLAFYTLPVKHPIVTSVLAKIGQLESDETVDLLTSEFLKANPDGYSAEEVEHAIRSELLKQAGGRMYYVKDGKLAYVDTAKINPLTGPIVEFAGDPRRGSLGLLSPILQSALNAALGEDVATGAKLTTKGALNEYGQKSDRGAGELGRIIARDTARLSPLLRGIDEAMSPQGQVQGDDSLPFVNDRPLRPRTEGQKKKLARKTRDRAKTPGGRALKTTVTAVDTNDKQTLERVKDAANYPELERVSRQLQQIERAAFAKGGEDGRDRAKKQARYRKLKGRERELKVRAGIIKPKKARKKRGSGFGSSGGGGFSMSSGAGW